MLFIIISLLMLSPQEKLNRAITLYETRHKAESYLEESRALFEEVLHEQPENEEALWRVAQLYYTYGDKASSKEEKLKFYEKGKEFAKKLIELNPNHPQGHFWFAVNLGRVAQTKGVLNSLFLAPTIKRGFEKALELYPKHTGAMNGLAVFYYELPGLLGGSLDKSLEWLNKAISIDPNYSLLYINFAKVYIKKKEYNKAREYLEKMLAIKNPSYPADFWLKDKKEAEEMLAEIKGK